MVKYLCKSLNVSRSGYYNYFNNDSIKLRAKREKSDESIRDIILKAFNFKNYKKGARQIKNGIKQTIRDNL